MEFDPVIRAYYERGEEEARLRGGFPSGPLEFERTKEIILRYLPREPRDVLDVGGGPGVHATWLAELGHRVHLIDPIPLHVEQALLAAPNISANVGDARDLEQADGSVDAVLLLGPLYHLVERDDRLRALTEARRVLRSPGFLFVAAISRYGALLDLLLRVNYVHHPAIFSIVEKSVRTGLFEGTTGGLFTTAYFHHPEELSEELALAGFEESEVLGIEGPGAFVTDFPERWADTDRRKALLDVARLVEDDPAMIAAGSHLMGVARLP
ncbi:MAG: class I SAM-dependent methyltransferase [Actinomycetota bacterium]